MCQGCFRDATITVAEADAMVSLGFQFLNEHAPDGWKGRVDINRLNMRSGMDCVGAQIYGDWFWFKAAVADHASYEDLCRMGFDTLARNSGNYDLLQTAWVKALTA